MLNHFCIARLTCGNVIFFYYDDYCFQEPEILEQCLTDTSAMLILSSALHYPIL